MNFPNADVDENPHEFTVYDTWSFSPSSEEVESKNVYPPMTLTDEQKAQWDMFNRLPLSKQQKLNLLITIQQEQSKDKSEK